MINNKDTIQKKVVNGYRGGRFMIVVARGKYCTLETCSQSKILEFFSIEIDYIPAKL